MKEIEFNLLEEPWIGVLMPDCSVREVSLVQALLHAQEYADLAGETPTQDVAVLRLMLAVMHTVFSRVDAAGQPGEITTRDQALQRWNEIWKLGHLPEKPIRDYFERWHDRFWLFHPERPFYQVPEAKAGTEYSAAKLNGELSESGNKIRMFSQYSGIGKTELNFSQAARWLLYVNGYDDTSAKPKGKGLPSPGAGWLGKLGLIIAQGGNLFETLMLNLALLKDGQEPWGENLPCWELNHPHSAERTLIAVPDNPAELLTLQSRRLLLKRENDRVVGFTLLGGDFFERENAFAEQMTVWRNTKPSKNGPMIYLPQRHDPAKQFWREFPAVFSPDPENHQPGIVKWITALPILRKQLVHFRIVSVKYGDKDFFVTDTFSDTLTFHAGLLEELSIGWRKQIKAEIGRCEQLANQVGYLAKHLSIASGDDDQGSSLDGKMQKARSRFYFEIDRPFRDWLAAIDPETETPDEAALDWQNQAQQIARVLGRQMVTEAGNEAFVGRTIKKQGNGKKTTEEAIHYCAPKALNQFLYAIYKIYHE